MSLPFSDCGAFFPGWADSPPDAKSLWQLVDEACADDPHLGASSFVDHAEASRYFRRHGGREGADFHTPGATHRRGRFRVTEAAQAAMGCKPYSNFNLVGAAQVGKSSLTGMRVLHRLGGRVPMWPVDPVPDDGPLVVEIYTALPARLAGMRKGISKIRDAATLDTMLAAFASEPHAPLARYDDHATDAILSAAWLRADAGKAELWNPPALTPDLARTEGWTFGAA
jgi:hypothetical protein